MFTSRTQISRCSEVQFQSRIDVNNTSDYAQKIAAIIATNPKIYRPACSDMHRGVMTCTVFVFYKKKEQEEIGSSLQIFSLSSTETQLINIRIK